MAARSAARNPKKPEKWHQLVLQQGVVDACLEDFEVEVDAGSHRAIVSFMEIMRLVKGSRGANEDLVVGAGLFLLGSREIHERQKTPRACPETWFVAVTPTIS